MQVTRKSVKQFHAFESRFAFVCGVACPGKLMGAIIAARAIQVLANFIWVSAINVPFYQPVAIGTRELAIEKMRGRQS
jgi:hypothetical protein